MKLNEIRDNEGSRKAKKRIGRGVGSGTGKTSGKGHKGAKARSGVSVNGFEGGQMPLHRRLPKRGFNNIFRKSFAEISLGRIQAAIDEKKLDTANPITAKVIQEAGLIRRVKDGVRILGSGKLTAKVNVSVAGATKSATTAIEKAGGSVTLITHKKGPRTGKTAVS
ncbi:MAG: 50S ribosomal protein L15 [Alphaproteobacteria bacterium]